MSDQDPTDLNRPQRIKGRGAASNREGRFEAFAKSIEDDGWHREDEGDDAHPHPVDANADRKSVV